MCWYLCLFMLPVRVCYLHACVLPVCVLPACVCVTCVCYLHACGCGNCVRYLLVYMLPVCVCPRSAWLLASRLTDPPPAHQHLETAASLQSLHHFLSD